jgi:hypothetical protein
VVLVLLLLVPACGGDGNTSGDVVARAERITADLADIVDDSPGIVGTLRYGCSADPGLEVAETSLSAPPVDSPRDVAVEMANFLKSEVFDTTLVDGEVGSGELVLRASDFELTIDVHFSAEATLVTVTTECLRGG